LTSRSPATVSPEIFPKTQNRNFSHMYENKKQPLASRKVFISRVVKNFIFTLLILFVCLMVGVLGYHYTANIPWLDSLHNASMILSGMGPVVNIDTVAGKWFSSFYALFSGVAFVTNIGVLLAPMVHRFFHKLHLEK
jgi:hypothetical protein